MHEKDTWRIANSKADLIQLQRKFDGFSCEHHWDWFLTKEKTNLTPRTFDESYCPAAKSYKIRISLGIFLFSKNKTNTAFQNSIADSNLQYRFHFLIFFYKSAGIHKILELLINIVMSLTNNLCWNRLFVNEY